VPGAGLLHHRQDKGKLGYFWEHVFLKAKSGPNLGGVVNPTLGAAILDSERQKLTYLDSGQGELSETLTRPQDERRSTLLCGRPTAAEFSVWRD